MSDTPLPNQIQIRGLAEVVLNVRNMGAALGFYQGVLGLERISPPEKPNPVFLRAGSATTSLPSLIVLVQLATDAAAFTAPRALHHLALAMDAEGFETAREALQAAGYAPRGGQHPILASRTMYVDDPDGNEVEFIAPV